jgi:hypothetical protein
MQMLVQQIESTLQTEKHCFIRPDELQRVWPHVNDYDRETAVRVFAREHGWSVFTYARGLGAMIVPSHRS